jgi:predicted RNA-binding protein YlxR (DUF448 family)
MQFTDYRALIKQIKLIEPKAVSQLKKDYKIIAGDMAKEVRRTIPKTYPLGPRKNAKLGGKTSGFNHSGRTAWGRQPTLNMGNSKAYPSNSVFIQTPSKKPRRGRYVSIARLKVNSAATAMADMTGRGGNFDTKGMSRAHDIRLFGGPVVSRQYRINGQGRALARNLSSGAKGKLKSGGSRYVWPAAEKKEEATRKQMIQRLQVSFDTINRNLAGR